MTAPFLKPIPRRQATRVACAGGLLLCLLGQDASAADVLVVTDSRHPVQSASGARVIELDLPAVVVDRRYVVYGETDVARAVARIESHRRAQP